MTPTNDGRKHYSHLLEGHWLPTVMYFQVNSQTQWYNTLADNSFTWTKGHNMYQFYGSQTPQNSSKISAVSVTSSKIIPFSQFLPENPSVQLQI